ncbi:MAG: DUF2974 domain-containing protein [Lachnospiraceae bacterium]|nr:DUF2974 domain-containing protein [Muribaculum sp.]MCM1409894.1 DUF2974 domain-containing protein [Lachnospiraceae bacterium]
MGNITSYLKWRGDISLIERPFGMVDNLVLSELAYMDFSGIVPSTAEGGEITVQDAAALCEERGNRPVIGNPQEDFFRILAGSRRFRTARLSHYADETDAVSQTEFSALHICLEDGTVYIAFRGTSDEIMDWREDFSMSYRIMPAQRRAAEYLEKTMTETDTEYFLGGHSKGGNLAVYAAVCCPKEKQRRIVKIYSNDGPGLCPDIIDPVGYEEIRHKIVRIIPEFSLIGKLFERDEPNLIVRSSAQGALSHDGFTWEIEGDQFIACASCSEDSRFFNDVFDEWIESASMEQREAFTKDFFDALEAGGAKKMSEITANGMDGIESILIALIRSENRTKIVVGKLLQSAMNRLQKLEWKTVLKTREMIMGILCFVIGLLVIAEPLLAGKCIGVVLGAFILFLTGKRLVACAMKPDADGIRKRWKLSFYLFFMCVIVTLLNQIDFVTGFTEMLLSGGFFILAYDRAKKASCKTRGKAERFCHGIISLFSLLFGILPVTAYALELTAYTLTAGTFVLIYGVAIIIKQICRESR